MKYDLELTDTFGGEANYCWVERKTIDVTLRRPDPSATALDRAVVRAAKKWAGLNGQRCSVSNYGDTFEIRPCGRNAPCVVLFVTWHDDSLDHA